MFGRKTPSLLPFHVLIAVIVLAFIGSGAAWLTHVITCLADGRWGFLIAGAIAFPIAIIHGIMIWFGFAG